MSPSLSHQDKKLNRFASSVEGAEFLCAKEYLEKARALSGFSVAGSFLRMNTPSYRVVGKTRTYEDATALYRTHKFQITK